MFIYFISNQLCQRSISVNYKASDVFDRSHKQAGKTTMLVVNFYFIILS